MLLIIHTRANARKFYPGTFEFDTEPPTIFAADAFRYLQNTNDVRSDQITIKIINKFELPTKISKLFV